MLLTKGTTYTATLELGLIKRQFSNEVVKQELEKYGLRNVVVTGEGKYRQATATYQGNTADIDLPKAITNIKAI